MSKPYRYQCPRDNCKSSFNRPYRLEQHLLVHENKRNFICSEDGCTKSYTNKSHLQRHINNTHKKTSDLMLYYPCLQCLRPYANRQNLKRHMKRKHSNDSKYCYHSCDVCKMDFKKKTHLRAHMFQHTGVKSYNCKLCSQEFITAYDRRRHMRYHKKYKCVECQIEFDHWSKYLEHRKSADHSQKVYICDYCQKQFTVRAHILRHMKNHNPLPVELIQCPYINCTRSYTRKANLKQHIEMFHINIKFDCIICDAKLSTKGKLKQHLKRHEEPLPVKAIKKGNQRNKRWDKGLARTSTAIKLAGLPQELINQEEIKSSMHDKLAE